MWHLGTWFSSGLGSVRFMVGLNDLQGLFQPKCFYDSMKFRKRENANTTVNAKHVNMTECTGVGIPLEKTKQKAMRGRANRRQDPDRGARR